MHEVFYYAYIVASRSHALYIGMTNDLERRVVEHKEGKIPGFAAHYNCNRLVWFERYTSPGSAIAREKQLKNWSRTKKLTLIERDNPTWFDLSEEWGKSFLKQIPSLAQE
jgi:putative endonuclease